MMVGAANPYGANPGASGSSASGGARNGQVDKMSYLKLIVAQLKNQNPLDPMDNAQFLTQLAQFNTLEQMQGLNDRLAEVVQGQSDNGLELARIGRTLENMLLIQERMLMYQQARAGGPAA